MVGVADIGHDGFAGAEFSRKKRKTRIRSGHMQLKLDILLRLTVRVRVFPFSFVYRGRVYRYNGSDGPETILSIYTYLRAIPDKIMEVRLVRV